MTDFGELGLEAIDRAVDRLPPSVFEKIPFAGPRYFREKAKEGEQKIKREKKAKDKMSRNRSRDRSSRRNNRPDHSDYDSSSDSDYNRRRRERRGGQGRRDGRDRGRDVRDRGYESDRGQPTAPFAPGGGPYFPPPPKFAVDDTRDDQDHGRQEGYTSRPYNPTEYGEKPGSRDTYFAGHPQERVPYTPPPVGGPTQPPQGNVPQAAAASAAYHSSAADRYRPANYYDRPIAPDAQPGSPRPNYPSDVAVRSDYAPYPGNSEFQRYSPPSSPDSRQRRYGSRGRNSNHGSPKRSSSKRSKSRLGEAGQRFKDGFEKHKKEAGASALGALAGSILGNELGGKRNAKMGMLIGAAIGGVGGGLWEKKHEAAKERKRLERRQSRVHDGYDSY